MNLFFSLNIITFQRVVQWSVTLLMMGLKIWVQTPHVAILFLIFS